MPFALSGRVRGMVVGPGSLSCLYAARVRARRQKVAIRSRPAIDIADGSRVDGSVYMPRKETPHHVREVH